MQIHALTGRACLTRTQQPAAQQQNSAWQWTKCSRAAWLGRSSLPAQHSLSSAPLRSELAGLLRALLLLLRGGRAAAAGAAAAGAAEQAAGGFVGSLSHLLLVVGINPLACSGDVGLWVGKRSGMRSKKSSGKHGQPYASKQHDAIAQRVSSMHNQQTLSFGTLPTQHGDIWHSSSSRSAPSSESQAGHRHGHHTRQPRVSDHYTLHNSKQQQQQQRRGHTTTGTAAAAAGQALRRAHARGRGRLEGPEPKGGSAQQGHQPHCCAQMNQQLAVLDCDTPGCAGLNVVCSSGCTGSTSLSG